MQAKTKNLTADHADRRGPEKSGSPLLAFSQKQIPKQEAKANPKARGKSITRVKPDQMRSEPIVKTANRFACREEALRPRASLCGYGFSRDIQTGNSTRA